MVFVWGSFFVSYFQTFGPGSREYFSPSVIYKYVVFDDNGNETTQDCTDIIWVEGKVRFVLLYLKSVPDSVLGKYRVAIVDPIWFDVHL